jgi:hypothetical protein
MQVQKRPEDLQKWLSLTTLKDQYPNLYNIVRRKSAAWPMCSPHGSLMCPSEELWLLKIYNLDMN